MNKYIILGTLVVLVVLMGSAAAVGPATTTWVSDTRGSETGVGNDVTEGGNITVLNLATSSITERWAGYLGNLSGNISLRNAAGNYMYIWTWTTTNEAEVCAGISTTYTWNGIASTTAGDIDTAWGFSGVSDTAASTFTAATGSINIAGVPITSTAVADTLPAGGFVTDAIVDSSGSTTDTDFLFCTDTNIATGTGYDGSSVDYELIVPVDYGALETYYFYAELN